MTDTEQMPQDNLPAEEVVENQHEQIEEQVEEHVEAEAPQMTDAEINMQRMRENYEKMKEERQRDRDLMTRMQEELLRREQAAAPQEQEEEQIAEDDWMTYGQFQKIQERTIKQVLEQERREAAKREAPERLRRNYPDLEQVITADNINRLNQEDPDVAAALASIQDEEKKAIATYKYIKRLYPQDPASIEAKKKLEANRKKPATLGGKSTHSPLAHADAFANGMTPDLKKQLWEEMNHYAKQS